MGKALSLISSTTPLKKKRYSQQSEKATCGMGGKIFANDISEEKLKPRI
jgi:hypothetical protein